MASRLYNVTMDAVAVTASQDLFYIAPADDKPVRVIGWDLSQTTDLGDAQEEILRMKLVRGHTTVGSGGNSATAGDCGIPALAASATCRINDTTIASAGTAVNLWFGGWNIRCVPSPFFLPEQLWMPCTQAEGSVVLRLLAAPADSITVSGTIWFLEGF